MSRHPLGTPAPPLSLRLFSLRGVGVVTLPLTRCDLSHVAPLSAGKAQLSLARLTLVVGSGNGARTIRRTAAPFVEQREIRIAVGQPDDDHPMMEKGRDARKDRGQIGKASGRERGGQDG